MKARNAKRRASEFKRVYGSRARVAWIRSQRCVGCLASGPCENAHIPSRSGMGRKGDSTQIVPLCPSCHRTLHDKGVIERRLNAPRGPYVVEFGLPYLRGCAEGTELAWQVYRRAGSNTRRKLEQRRASSGKRVAP